MDAEAKDMNVQPTVFIVDDDEAVRSGVADLVESMGLPVQTLGSADEFLCMYNPDWPGCLILDLQMPGMSGLELQTAFSERGIRLPVIVMTGHGDVNAAVRSMKLGAVDFIEKPFRELVLSACIQKALMLDAKIRRHQSEQRQFAAKLSHLTAREREVMDLMIVGKTDKQISCELHITHRAVSYHRLHLLEKIQVSSLIELANLANSIRSPK